eukprot:scaffold2076_cov69-Skeletonema_dohrnii-CCMP3373.AAC.3
MSSKSSRSRQHQTYSCDSHSSLSSSSRYHSQSRAGRWRNSKKRFLDKAKPSHKELFQASRRRSRRERSRAPIPKVKEVAQEDVDQQEDYLEAMLDSQEDDSYGLPPPPKDHDTLRLILNNVHGLKLFTDGGERVGRIETTRKNFHADIYCCVENWLQWDMASSEQQFEDIFGIGEERYSSVAFNRNDRLSGRDGKTQPGGTSILVTGRASGFASMKGMDDESLGQWCYIRLGTEQQATWLCCAYNPPSSTRYVRRNARHRSYTVYSQRRRHLRVSEQTVSSHLPANIFLSSWSSSYWNGRRKDVYSDALAVRLGEDDLLMACQFQKINDEKLPNSHETGRKPLMAVFATEGVVCTNAYAGSHGASVGDHRLLIYDFHAPSILGTHLPHMPRPPGRGVRSKIPRLRNQYNRRVNELNQRNRMHQRLDSIVSSPQLSSEQKRVLLDRWDEQEVGHQLCGERACNRGGNRNVEFCEEVSILLRKQRCLDRVILYLRGKIPDGRNLFKLCRAIDVPEPRDTTIEEAQQDRFACIKLIEEIRDDAPILRERMLRKRVAAAHRRGDDESVVEINRIIKKEARKKKFRVLKLKMGRPRAAPLCEVKVPDEEFPEFAPHYTERADVELETGDCIRTRYQLGLRSALASEPFLSDIGHLGDGPAVQQILQGTYLFPPDTPPAIESLFQEAAKLYSATKDMDFSPYITVEEYQYWWRHCRLDTQSSFSNIHCCAAHDDDLSALQVAYSSWMASKEVAPHSHRTPAKGNGDCLCQQTAGDMSL